MVRFPPPSKLVERTLGLPKGSVSADLRPDRGAHRPKSDVVFAAAHGDMYGLTFFGAFLGSLNTKNQLSKGVAPHTRKVTMYLFA